MDAVEAVRCPAALDLAERAAHQVAGVGGDDADVIAVRLEVDDVLAADQLGAAAGRVDGERVVSVLRRLGDPRQRLGHARAADRLHQVVERAQLERLDRGRLVGGDEDQRGRRSRTGAARGRARRRRDPACGRRGRPRRSARRRARAAPPRRTPRSRPRSPRAAPAVPARDRRARAARRRRRGFSSRAHPGAESSARASCTIVPPPAGDSTSSPYSGPNVDCRRAWTFASPMPSPRPSSAALTASSDIPAPPSLTVSSTSASRSAPRISTRHGPVAFSTPCRTAFSTSGCIESTGTTAVSTSGATLTRTSSRSPNRAFSSRRYFST